MHFHCMVIILFSRSCAINTSYVCVFTVSVTVSGLCADGACLRGFGTVFCGVGFDSVAFVACIYVCVCFFAYLIRGDVEVGGFEAF